MEDKTRSRKWLLTINNPVDNNLNHDAIKAILEKFRAIKYWCMCDEVGKEGTYHTHLFISANNGVEFSAVKKRFPKAHIDFCKGTAQENREYIRKEGKYKGSTKEETNISDTFEENGELPIERQGQRNDLIELYDMIKAGMSNYDIISTNPSCIHYIEKIDKCRDIIKREELKSIFRELSITYIYGTTRSGKTRSVMEKYGYENVYRVTDYIHPFDNYSGQNIIIFEEFRSSLKIQDMLNYLDGYPLDLPCRYNNKIACYTKVYIISNISLNEQFPEVQRNYEETWKAFINRIHKVQIFNNEAVKEYSINEYLHGFIPIEQKDIPFNKEEIYKQELLEL